MVITANLNKQKNILGLRLIKTNFVGREEKRQGQANGGACPCIAEGGERKPERKLRQFREQRATEGLLQKPLSAFWRTTDDGKFYFSLIPPEEEAAEFRKCGSEPRASGQRERPEAM